MVATFLAEWVIWTVPLLIGIGWLRGSESIRKAVLVAAASGLLACSSTKSSAWHGCISGLS